MGLTSSIENEKGPTSRQAISADWDDWDEEAEAIDDLVRYIVF